MKLEKTVQNSIRTARRIGRVNTTICPLLNGGFDMFKILNTAKDIFYPDFSKHFLLDTIYEQVLEEVKPDALCGPNKEVFVAKRSKALSAYMADGLSKVFWLKPGGLRKQSADAIHIWKKKDVLGVSRCCLSGNGRLGTIEVYLAVDLGIMRRGTQALALVNNAEELRKQWRKHFAAQFIKEQQLDLLEVAARLCAITQAAQRVQPANYNVQPAQGQPRPNGRHAETNLPEEGISFAVRCLRFADGEINFTDMEPMDVEEYLDLVEDGHAMAANDDGMAGYADLPVIDLDQPRRGRRQKGAPVLHDVRGHWRHTKHHPEGVWVHAYKRGDKYKVVLNKIVSTRKPREPRK